MESQFSWSRDPIGLNPLYGDHSYHAAVVSGGVGYSLSFPINVTSSGDFNTKLNCNSHAFIDEIFL